MNKSKKRSSAFWISIWGIVSLIILVVFVLAQLFHGNRQYISLEVGSFALASVTLYALIIELKRFKDSRRTKVFSELNNHYINDYKNIQPVIEYIRNNSDDSINVSGQQVELFLRFFEELDVYLKEGVLDDETTHDMFAYYCLALFENKPELLKDIEYKKEEWPLLEDFKKRMLKVKRKSQM